MSDTLTVTLHDAQQGHRALSATFWPAAKAHLMAGRKMVAELRPYEDHMTDKQRRFLHGYILKTIAQQARPNGEQFPLKVWKEWYRAEFLGHKTATTKDPFTGRRVRRRVRVSTEDLGVKGYSQYIDRVAAHAASELGVEFMSEWTDPDTGEIYRLREMRGQKDGA